MVSFLVRYFIVLAFHERLFTCRSKSDIRADSAWMVEMTQAMDALTDLIQGPCTVNQDKCAEAFDTVCSWSRTVAHLREHEP